MDIVGEFEPDDLQQVTGAVGLDGKDLWWVGFGFKIDDDEDMVEGVEDGVGFDAVLVGGSVDLHIAIL
jgi:hypothetical protein